MGGFSIFLSLISCFSVWFSDLEPRERNKKNMEKNVIMDSITDASASMAIRGSNILLLKKKNIKNPVKTIKIPEMNVEIVPEILAYFGKKITKDPRAEVATGRMKP